MTRCAQPMITVIVPTRERAETLQFTLATILDQVNDFEIIVSDNYSQDNTKEVVQSYSDRRLRYINTGRRVSMSDNWEFALEHARGNYVIIIGDDDAVIPNALDKLQVFIQANRSKVYSWPLHVYYWPIDGRRPLARLASVRSAREMDLERLARRVISLGGWRYYKLPSIYHAAVEKRILDAIREKTGRVFHSTQPDVFTSMAIPAVADRALNIGYSVTVTGHSTKANSAKWLAKDGEANIMRYVREFGDYRVHQTLFPNVPDLAKFLPDAILVAMDKFPEFYGQMAFNYDAMWAFLCRLKLASRQEVLRKRAQIRHYSPFNTARFLLYFAIQHAAVLRRTALDRCRKITKLTGHVPDNIRDFARLIATQHGSVNPWSLTGNFLAEK